MASYGVVYGVPDDSGIIVEDGKVRLLGRITAARSGQLLG